MSRTRPAVRVRTMVVVVVVALVVIGCEIPPESSPQPPRFGVLIADPSHLQSDYAAGVRVAVRSLNWSRWQPQQGQTDAAYRAQEIAIVDQYRKAGFTVAIDLGLHYAPSWVLGAAGGRLHDQAGNVSTVPNFEFSSAVRSAAEVYMRDVVSSLGAVAYYKVGFSKTGEALYPTPVGNGWWAFDSIAQGTGAGRPSGIGNSPMPGWVPGTSTWNGSAVTSSQVSRWYDWYLGALANGLSWEMGALRSAGHVGQFQLAFPGNGANPWVYSNRLAGNLAPQTYDSYRTMNVGAVYQELIGRITPLTNVVIDITSVGDHSGSPKDNLCQAGDAAVDYRTEPSVDKWSSTRWLSYLAGKHGLAVTGESTGQNSATEMSRAFTYVSACDLTSLQWAFDYQLYGGTYATIGDYAAHIDAATP